MKNYAKWLVLALCLVLCLAVFAGCDNSKPSNSQTPGQQTTGAADPTSAPTEDKPVAAKYMKAGETYRILIWSNAVEDQELQTEGIRGQLINEAYNRMKEQYGVTPLYIAAPADWLGETMNSVDAGAPITDLFHFGGPFTLPSLYTHGGERGAILEAISDYDIDFSDGEYWDQTSQATGTFDGKQYVIAPNAIGFDAVSVNVVTFFNKSLIKKAGYTADQLYDWSNNGEWTFDKFREVVLACTDLDNGVYGTTLNQNALLMSTMIASNGSDMITKKNGVDTFNMLDSKALTAINYLVDMCKNDKSVMVDFNAEEAATFAAGTAALMVTYSNRLDVKSVKDMADDYGILMPPKGPDATEYISDMNWFTGYLVLKKIANPAGAVEFANFFMKPAYAKSSPDQAALMAAQGEAYRLDAKSIEILTKVQNVSHTTSYMIYWSCASGSDSIASICNYQFPSFVDGSLSPDTYYASVESLANSILSTAMGIQ